MAKFRARVAHWDDKETRLQLYDRRLAEAARTNAKAKRLLAVPGIGIRTVTAMIASVTDATAYSTLFGHAFHADSATDSRGIRPGGRSEATLVFGGY